MNLELPTTNKSQIGYEILAYLVEHPEAQDTLEGILEWWLLERQIKFQIARVQEVLSELVSKGLILEKKASDSQTHYRINQVRYKKIKELLNQKNR
ncbi:MAG: hypothetical protein ACYSSN_00390 [Planctomycetota bacterium]